MQATAEMDSLRARIIELEAEISEWQLKHNSIVESMAGISTQLKVCSLSTHRSATALLHADRLALVQTHLASLHVTSQRSVDDLQADCACQDCRGASVQSKWDARTSIASHARSVWVTG